MVRRVGAVVVGLLLGLPLSAQVIAVQGPTKVRRFESPMILTMPFELHPAAPDAVNQGPWGNSEDLKHLICNEVALHRLKYKGGNSRDGILPVTITAYMLTEQGHSKVVDLKFELLKGDIVVATASLGRTYSLDRTIQTRGAQTWIGNYPDVTIGVKESDLQSSPAPILRVTVSVSDWQ